jgi:hypothetical protein
MLRKIALLLLVAHYGVAIAAAKPEKQVDDGKGGTQAAQPDKRGTKDSPLIVETRTTHSDSETAEEAEKEAEQKHVNGWSIGLTIVIAACAFLQFCGIIGQIVVYLKQTRLMKDTLRAIGRQGDLMDNQVEEMKLQRKQTVEEMKRQAYQMEQQASATFASAHAAEESAKAANDQIRMLKDRERARIKVTPVELDVIPIEDFTNIMIEFSNFGPTHAFNVRVEAGGRITITGDEPEETVYGDLAITTTLQPNAIESSWVPFFFHNRWEENVRLSKAKILFELFGEIEYQDIFGDSHTINFSYSMKAFSLDNLTNNRVRLRKLRGWYPTDGT